MRAISLVSALVVFFASSEAFAESACYTFTNNAPQTVNLRYEYLNGFDGSFSPTGQYRTVAIRSGETTRENCLGYNTFAHFLLINGAYNGWSPFDIFGIGQRGSEHFTIVANRASAFFEPATPPALNSPKQTKLAERKMVSQIAITLNAGFITTGETHQIRMIDQVCNQASTFSVVGGNQYERYICANESGYGHVLMTDLTTHSQAIGFGQVYENDSLNVP
ncbi:hypothetical protein [Bradyrhizobium sp. SZCCHNR1015]|uniref:hypothetical protein n=1 Tax=Bradyrhizobium sp. SZCCHNR1015 TaxID=3057338 RepID=UPI002915C5BB|nr:hypothetical protein [Bradyrhizobium sp. SZCCHNR1015]